LRKILYVFLAVLLIVALAVPTFAAYKPEYKMSVNPSATTPWGQGAIYFADLVRQKTDGRVNIKVYCSAQLMAGKQTSEFLLVRNGAIDFALSSTINWSPQVKELNLPALPFFVASGGDRFKAMDAIENGKSGKIMIDAIEKKGVKVLGWGENGFRELTNNVRPVTTPEDMKDLKIRVVGSPLYIDIFKALGANPINMNWSEATTGFQQGVVDGQENPVGVLFSVKIWSYHKYMTDWHYVIDPLLFAVNPGVFKSFTDTDRKIIMECAIEASKFQKAVARIGLDDGSSYDYLKSINALPKVTEPYKYLEENGMTVTKLSRQQVEAFKSATADVMSEWRKELGEDFVETAEQDMASCQ